jgi:hypothetical protein
MWTAPISRILQRALLKPVLQNLPEWQLMLQNLPEWQLMLQNLPEWLEYLYMKTTIA